MSEKIRVPFVDLQAQYHLLSLEIQAAMGAALERADFILGQDVELFEQEFARYLGVRHAVGVGSGLAALELALRAYGIGHGSEVITAANTYIATVLAIYAVGAHPVLVDVDPATYNMDPAALDDAVNSRTTAIMPVHLYGQPAAMEEILAVARRHDLLVIEDAAQAHGARYHGRRVGAFGDAAAFSFYPAKNLGAYGDGGMVVTNDAAIAEKVRHLRNYGQRVKYEHAVQGTNSRLDTLQAAVLRVKLRFLDAWNDSRRQHAANYARVLNELPIQMPAVADGVEHVFHLYVVQTDERDRLRKALDAEGIGAGIHYPIPIHLQKACADLGYQRGEFPVTEAAADRILSLPMFPELTDVQIAYVAESLGAAFGKTSGATQIPAASSGS